MIRVCFGQLEQEPAQADKSPDRTGGLAMAKTIVDHHQVYSMSLSSGENLISATQNKFDLKSLQKDCRNLPACKKDILESVTGKSEQILNAYDELVNSCQAKGTRLFQAATNNANDIAVETLWDYPVVVGSNNHGQQLGVERWAESYVTVPLVSNVPDVNLDGEADSGRKPLRPQHTSAIVHGPANSWASPTAHAEAVIQHWKKQCRSAKLGLLKH